MTSLTRPSGRAADQMRDVRIERQFTKHAEGSVLISFGDTRVLCTASVENRVPGFLRGKGEGWVTAEYGMLPRSTHERMGREAAQGKQGGRTLEIQRLIGRSLRACVDRKALGERTITLDCDVLQADGGTRTAAITGAYVALCDAVSVLLKRGDVSRDPVFGGVAAVSVLAALTGFWDWLRSTEAGTQARRTANAHAVTMLTVTVLALVDIALRLNVYDTRTHPTIAILALSIVVAALVSLGATFGGTLVYDYGFNVETASDSPVWHKSETDVLPGEHSE